IVHCLAVADTGSGAALYAGGQFYQSGSSPMGAVGRWTGTQWAQLATGVGGIVETMTPFNDGTATSLYIGGLFGTAGTVTAPNIIRWNGSAFSPLGAGPIGTVGTVTALAAAYSPEPSLCMGGSFRQAGNLSAGNLAKWGCVPPLPC